MRGDRAECGERESERERVRVRRLWQLTGVPGLENPGERKEASLARFPRDGLLDEEVLVAGGEEGCGSVERDTLGEGLATKP